MEQFDDVLECATGADLVHVSSVLPDAITTIERLLTRMNDRNPNLLVSFDPGDWWTREFPPGVQNLYRMAHILFVSRRELDAIAENAGIFGMSRPAGLARLLPRMRVMFVKERDGVRRVARDNLRWRTVKASHTPLSHDEIVDDTGAGDLFAGLMLPILARGNLPGIRQMDAALVLIREFLTSAGDLPTSRVESFREFYCWEGDVPIADIA
jgi:sugar/nucleoside kinase (ribokinase family)